MDRNRSRSRCHRGRATSALDGGGKSDDDKEWSEVRKGFYAHRALRLMAKSAVAQRLGADVCWLLCVIVLQEDAVRYLRPVTFWNDQLLPLVGFAKRDRLAKARKKAIDAGWLIYREGGRHVPGEYRVTIPVELQGIFDCAVDEGSTPGNGWREGLQEGIEAGGKRASNRGSTGATFLPVPVPVPAPDPLSVPGRGTTTGPKNRVGKKQLDWLPDWPELRDFVGTTIEPIAQSDVRDCLKGQRAFEPLTEKFLANAKEMRDWHRWQLTLASPVLGPTEAHTRLMLATAQHVLRMPKDQIRKNRVALFADIISKRRWDDVRERLAFVDPQMFSRPGRLGHLCERLVSGSCR